MVHIFCKRCIHIKALTERKFYSKADGPVCVPIIINKRCKTCGINTARANVSGRQEAFLVNTVKMSPSRFHASCRMRLLHGSEMHRVEYSANLNVMHNTLLNGPERINTISWERVSPTPSGTVNVLIAQRWATIKLFHEFQWDSFTRLLQREQNTITTTQNMLLCHCFYNAFLLNLFWKEGGWVL